MSFINPLHIAFVAVVALLVLGPKRFPEVARSIGNGYRELREQLSAVTEQARTRSDRSRGRYADGRARRGRRGDLARPRDAARAARRRDDRHGATAAACGLTRPGGRSDGAVRGPGDGPASRVASPGSGCVTTPPARVASPRAGRRAPADWSADSARSGGCACDLRSWWKKIEHTSASSVVSGAAVWSAAPNGWIALAGPGLSKPDTHPGRTSSLALEAGHEAPYPAALVECRPCASSSPAAPSNTPAA